MPGRVDVNTGDTLLFDTFYNGRWCTITGRVGTFHDDLVVSSELGLHFLDSLYLMKAVRNIRRG